MTTTTDADAETVIPSKTERLVRALTCPPVSPLSTIAALLLLLVVLYGCLWGFMGDPLLPRGGVFALFVLVIACYVGGQLIRLIKIPSLVGMMLCGFILRNVPHIDVANDIPDEWAGTIRNTALVLILLRAGLEVDATVLKTSPGICLKLILIPFAVECATCSVISYYALGLPWKWALLMGFMLSAVSPAVVLPVMLKLQKKGIGVTTGIPTMVIAVAGIDDVLALTGFEILLGVTFSAGTLAWNIGKGPLEALVGVTYGVTLGYLLWYIPNVNEPSRDKFRLLIMVCGGMFVMFGSHSLHFGAAGALGCICLPFVAAIKWKRQGWNLEENLITDCLAFVWRITEPFLFGLIGSEIRMKYIHGNFIGVGLAVLLVGLALRMVAALVVSFGAGLSIKEQIFVMFAGIPKATVQAAIGPVALAYVKERQLGEEFEDYGVKILTVAVLAILITAPLGATAISLLAPRLLDGDEKKMKDEENYETSLKAKPRFNETRISIFDPDSNIFTTAKL